MLDSLERVAVERDSAMSLNNSNERFLKELNERFNNVGNNNSPKTTNTSPKSSNNVSNVPQPAKNDNSINEKINDLETRIAYFSKQNLTLLDENDELKGEAFYLSAKISTSAAIRDSTHD